MCAAERHADDSGDTRPTVLVVDDDALNVDLLTVYLEEEGYNVSAAFSGSAALDVVAGTPPDLIFLDAMMPGMDGFTVCRQLKSNPDTRVIPIVIVTALSTSEDRVQGIEAGADDFLSKPVNRHEFVTRARSLLRIKRYEEEVREQLDFTRTVTTSLGEGVCAVDGGGRLTFMNPAAEAMLGWTQEELRGKNTHEVFHFQTANGERVAEEDCALLAVLSSGAAFHSEKEVFTRRDGSIFPIACTSSALVSKERILGAVVAFWDITQRKEEEAQLLSAKEETEAANREISRLNHQLQEENLRLSAELEVTRRLQQMVLPRPAELSSVAGLGIAAYMHPATEVGGDYYDVLQDGNGKLKIGIGDVTGHGLESGVLMLMVQMAVRTLQAAGEGDPERFLAVLNEAVWGNLQRMGSDKNLSLSLVDYEAGCMRLSGQHESLLLARSGKPVQIIETTHLGFPIGMMEEIGEFLAHREITLERGDVAVLYSDGIPEAENSAGEHYGMERVCSLLEKSANAEAEVIKDELLDDLQRFIGAQKLFDDITLIVLKQL
ncbi:MAG TPA: hypothetical protein DEV93_09070 [Chloroflexi bacterium]|jgi:PAS domain S-box-containing protein|nr:hypothetical protein [Chloroflexota bacterium]